MNRLSDIYYTIESYLFPMVEEEIGEITGKMKEFLRILEVVRPSRFLTNALRWCGLGRPMKDREKIFRAFLVKSVYDFPTTKLLIENLKTNPGLRRLCGCTSIITHYDENGKVIKVEEATNFSRAMDGTNSKSQIVMVDGSYFNFEASATAGENCTPGVKAQYINGKGAFVNSRDSVSHKGTSAVIEKFFAGEIKLSPDGIEKR